MKKIFIITFLSVLLAFPLTIHAELLQFSDVTTEHWSYEYIEKLKNLGIMKGMGNGTFGVGRTMTRAEFVTALGNLMKWENHIPASMSFSDVPDNEWYFGAVETALFNGAIPKSETFRPTEPITREEIAIISVCALGYNNLAANAKVSSSFSDVSNNAQYIEIAKNFGIVSGMGGDIFAPNDTAKREQAATIFVRMNDLLNNKINFTNGFYAISSYSQINMINNFDAVGFGWSRLEFEGDSLKLNFTASNANEYSIPNGFEQPFETANGKARLLMVAVKDEDSARIINNSELRAQTVNLIFSAVKNGVSKDNKNLMFDGVVIDFESLQADSKLNFNNFLSDLRAQIPNKLIYVAVQPTIHFGGYDYKTIGEVADKVILMAHDFNAKTLTDEEMAQGIVMTPPASIGDVYKSLAAITDENTGVRDKNKIVLQINFASVQWKMQNGAVLNKTPYTPDYKAIYDRIKSGNVEMKYNKDYETPYLTYKNIEDNTDNVIFYEDARSVNAKINLVQMFGISGVSVWRLGNVPNYESDIWLNVEERLSEIKN